MTEKVILEDGTEAWKRKDGTLSPTHGSSTHDSDCACPRCSGFQRGNTINLRDGTSAVILLASRAAEIADALRQVVPNYSPSDEPTVQDLALVKAQLERAGAALEMVEAAEKDNPLASFVGEPGERFERLRDRLDKLIARSQSLQRDLGLSPRSRFELGLVAAQAVLTAGRVSDEEYDRSRLSAEEADDFDRLREALDDAQGDLLALHIRDRARLLALARKVDPDARS